MSVRTFTELCRAIEGRTDEDLLTFAVRDYIAKTRESEIVWGVSLLTGIRPTRITTQAELRQIALAVTQIPEWLFDECQEASGDLAETIALVLPESSTQDELDLEAMVTLIQEHRNSSATNRDDAIKTTWDKLDLHQRLIFNKLATGTFRQKVAARILARVIGERAGRPATDIVVALSRKWDPKAENFDSLFTKPMPGIEDSRPVPFVQEPEEINNTSDLGQLSEWIAERAIEGISAQIIRRNGNQWVWTVSGDLVTDQCREFADLEGDFVITGWIVAHNEGRFLSAERASKRLSKKTASKKDLQDNPLLFVARDLLELGRRDLSGIPLKERRQQLEELVGKEDIPSLPIAEALAGESWDGLDAQRLGSRAHQSPGIILRKRDALHSADVKTLFWPADPYSITAVLLYAQRGMQGMYSEMNFAVRQGDTFVPFTRVNEGLTKEEQRELAAWIKDNTIERFGPVSSVEPVLVFELEFESIAASGRTKSGVIIKGASIRRWIKDGEVASINSLSDLHQLLP